MADYNTPLTHAVAGAVGGCAALSITYPLQAISMRLQIAQRKAAEAPASSPRQEAQPSRGAAVQPSPSVSDSLGSVGNSDTESEEAVKTVPAAKPQPKKREGELAAIVRILRETIETDGVGRLYSGLGSALYGQALIQAAYYYFYAALSAAAAARRNGKPSGVLENIVVSSMAGAAGATITNPLWVVNAQKVKSGGSEGTLAALLRIMKTEGPAGLFRGLSAALILVANPTVAYTVFERLKDYVLRSKPAGATLSAREIFVLSAVGKLIATLCTYPYLLAKTTLQAQSKGTPQYNSISECLTDVYSTGGLAGLYKGVNSKMWQSILTAALLFVLQEKCVRLVIGMRKAVGI